MGGLRGALALVVAVVVGCDGPGDVALDHEPAEVVESPAEPTSEPITGTVASDRCTDRSGGYRLDYGEGGGFEPDVVDAEMPLVLTEVLLDSVDGTFRARFLHDRGVERVTDELSWSLVGTWEDGGTFFLIAWASGEVYTLHLRVQQPADEMSDGPPPGPEHELASGEVEFEGGQVILSAAWEELSEHGVEPTFRWFAELRHLVSPTDGNTAAWAVDSCPDIDRETLTIPLEEMPVFENATLDP